jgi:glycosyltransferase involved in cell wall biosynthesis
LILAANLPYPPASGGALRTYGILYGLQKAGHKLTLLTFHDGRSDPMQTPLAALCEQIIAITPPTRTRVTRIRDLVLTREADIARRLHSAGFVAALTDLLQKQTFDLIQFEGIEVANYIFLAKKLAPKARLVFDNFNAEAELQRLIARLDAGTPRRWPIALYSLIQSQRIKQFEGDVCRAANHVIAVSDEDAALLRAYNPDGRLSVVPSGIFVDQYTQSERTALPPNALVFTGKMDYRPNVDAVLWFAETILPQLPDAHLIIVGQQPSPRVQALTKNGRIQVTGQVASVLPYLHGASVYIAPLRMGSGTRLKLLEAMAARCAIVATPLAASGLSQDAKSAMRIAETPDAFARAVDALLRDPEKRRTVGEKARTAVKRQYDWDVLIPRLLEVYRG